MDQLLATLVAGVAGGMPLFIVASGLTLIFGVMGVLNFAHGGFMMIGAFVLTSFLADRQPSGLNLLLGVLVVIVVLAVVGGLCEVLIFRRLYEADHVTSLLASYALLLVILGATERIWTASPRSQWQVPSLEGSVSFLGARVAVYDLVLVGVGLAIAAGLWFLLQRTTYGLKVRAVAGDELMARAMGIRAKRVSISVFVLGAVLAGIAGVVVAPLTSVDLHLAPSYVLIAFAVVIIGGLGSVAGALVAALLLGISESVLISYAPEYAGLSMYVVMGVMLLVRPQGLFGQKAASEGAHA